MRRACNTINSPTRGGGFSLIEVLVAMLVLSIGVLGVAGMQVTALKNLQSSSSFGVAAMLANDMADRMWINQAQALANAYNHTAAASTPAYCVDAACSNADLAEFDVAEWQQQIKGYTTGGGVVVPPMLPSAQGSVVRDGVTSSFEIGIYWDDDHSGSTASANCPPLSAADLDCYELTVTF
jgi:type IV pilus assembly protein PilV